MRNQRHLRSLLRGLPLRWRRQKWRGYCVVCSHRTQYWVPTAVVAPCHDLGRHILATAPEPFANSQSTKCSLNSADGLRRVRIWQIACAGVKPAMISTLRNRWLVDKFSHD